MSLNTITFSMRLMFLVMREASGDPIIVVQELMKYNYWRRILDHIDVTCQMLPMISLVVFQTSLFHGALFSQSGRLVYLRIACHNMCGIAHHSIHQCLVLLRSSLVFSHPEYAMKLISNSQVRKPYAMNLPVDNFWP